MRLDAHGDVGGVDDGLPVREIDRIQEGLRIGRGAGAMRGQRRKLQLDS